MSRRSVTAPAMVAALALVLVLAACSAQPTEEGTSTSEPASEAPAAGTSAPASVAAGEPTVLVAESDLGQILTDAEGRAIYFFANDSEGTSTCEGDCLENWPPVPADEGPTAGEGVTAELGTTTATDGTTMLTVNGFPAYYFAGDQEPGDTNGQGVSDVWWVFGADGEPIEG